MAGQRNWNALSSDYRERLERRGITRGEYESGISLKGARGHEKTPERPERAERNPTEFQDYIFKRDKLVSDIVRRKYELFGTKGKYNAARSRRAVSNTIDNKPRSIASLNRVLRALGDRDNWNDVVTSEDLHTEDISALYYH